MLIEFVGSIEQAKKEEISTKTPADLKFEEMQQYANNLDIQVNSSRAREWVELRFSARTLSPSPPSIGRPLALTP